MTGSAIWNDWSCRVRVTVTEVAKLAATKQQVTDLMAEVSQAANRFDPTSELSRINAAAGHLIPVSGRTIALADVAAHAIANSLNTGVLVEIGGDVAVAGTKKARGKSE